ncbi:GMC family oxidoreductase [Pseudomonas putida]|uniref:GMC family oxidoreductase n=1 Tax=Pseudomonas putida TaxID=303 RepID=A0A4D6XI43_PSEPU|nr:GMC family oxidoreductase [Pseudomonas putida]
MTKTPQFDAIVVGSGAAGSFAAKELTEAGLRVALLEAGPPITPEFFVNKGERPSRSGFFLRARMKASALGQYVQARVIFFSEQLRHLYVNDWQNPYTTPRDKPFLWVRGKQIGGRLHTFGRVLMRWSDYDFKGASKGSGGKDWPFDYSELSPFYERAERFLGVHGTSERVPTLPDGSYAKPSKLVPAEMTFKKRLEGLWPRRRVVPWRYVPPHPERVPQAILAAQRTGLLTIHANAVVKRIEVDPATGRATGVVYADRESKLEHRIDARAVVVCASPVESVRLLLNSTSPNHPRGLGNSNGQLGLFFMDQCPALLMGRYAPAQGWEEDDSTPPDSFYRAPGGFYIPRFTNLDSQDKEDFKGGYTYQGAVGRMPVASEEASFFVMMGFGEMLPHRDNTITINGERKDAWGVPVPHITCSMHENEQKLLKSLVSSAMEMVEQTGGTVDMVISPLGLIEKNRGAFPEASRLGRWMFRRRAKHSMCLGAAIHESGGACMGEDRDNSVLNPFNQCWDAPNVLVTDASSFPTGGALGTTLTSMAVTIRACQHLVQEMRAERI